VTSDEIILYTLEKRTKTQCNHITTYVVVYVFRPMNVTNHLYVEQYLHQNDRPYVLDYLDVRYMLESFLISTIGNNKK